MVDFCISQSQDGVDHEADYRALTKDGDYVWIRDVVHVIRDEHGETVSLVGFMFDISARKKSEEELLKLKKKTYFSLNKYVYYQLKSLGLKKIDLIDKDTYNPKNNFFSARRAIHNNQNDYGRNISLIMIK